MQIHSLYDPIALHYSTFAGDVYTLDTASITLTAGTLTAATGIISKTESAGDVPFYLRNTYDNADTAGSVSIIAQTEAGNESMGMIRFRRLGLYTTDAGRLSGIDIYTTFEGTDTLALAIDSGQNFNFQDGVLSTTGDINVGDLNLVDGAEIGTLRQNGNWIEIDKGTGFGTTIDGHVLTGDDAVYWKPGLNTATLNIEAVTPTIFQKAVRTTGTGVAYNMFELYVENDQAVDTKLGIIGFYVNANQGGVPAAYYIFMGATPTTAYNNAVLKIDVNDRVGIGFASTNRPSSVFSVVGDTRLGDDTTNYTGFSATGVQTYNGSAKITGLKINTVAKTAAYTATAIDDVITCGAGNETFTITLPAVATSTGKVFHIKNVGTGTITVDGNAAENIDGAATAVLTTQYEAISIVSTGSEWFIF